MPEMALRAVLSFDAASQSYKPSAHNLPANQAASYADDLRAQDGVDSRIIEQKTRHKAKSADQCGPCKKAAGKERAQPQPSSELAQPESESENTGETSV